MNFPYDDQTNKTYLPTTMRAIEKYLRDCVEEKSIEEHPQDHRTHLGASEIGDECNRKLWFKFRWCKLENFEGRMRRLFHRGHLEEEQFIDKLHWMGFFVRNIDQNTGKQYQFSAVGGHHGGSGDSVLLMPWDRGEDGQRILAEYKTHNAKQFEKFKSKGIKISHPKHWAQMCEYGNAFKTRYGLYCGICKDTDEVEFQFLELDLSYGEQLIKKAENIIISKFPPPRISDNPAYYACSYCHFHGICHKSEPVEINCRSCRYAEAIDNAQWKCNLYNLVLPKENIKKGCTSHVGING